MPYYDQNLYYSKNFGTVGSHIISSTGKFIIFVYGTNAGASYGFIPFFNSYYLPYFLLNFHPKAIFFIIEIYFNYLRISLQFDFIIRSKLL